MTCCVKLCLIVCDNLLRNDCGNIMIDFERELHVFNSQKLVAVVNEAIEFFARTPVHILPPPERFLGGGVLQGRFYALRYNRST